MDTNGFYGDTFSSGFGDFYTAKRSLGPTGGKETPFSEARKFYSQEPEFAFLAPNRLKVTKFLSKKKKKLKLLQRRPEMDTNGFYGDTFSSGFGDFYTAKRDKIRH